MNSITMMNNNTTAGSELDPRDRPSKSVAESMVEISQLMRPQHANFAGNVHGGTILSLMDEVAYTCASRFAETYCVTVHVDQVEFLAPVKVGDLLRLKASVTLAGRTSMEIGISIVAEDPRRSGSERRTNRCFFTMVAMGEEGKPTPVPALRLETPDDRTWHCEAQMRQELRKRFNDDLAAGACDLESID